jgi:integrase
MPAVSISRFADELLAFYSPPRRQPKTRRQVAQVLRELTEIKGLKTTADLRTASIVKWMDLHPLRSAVTTKSLLRCMQAVCAYAVGEGYLKQSPFDRHKVNTWIRDDAAPVQKRPLRHRSPDDIASVLDLADAEAQSGGWESCRLRALVYVYAYLGLRAAEALHLWAADVDLAREVITVQRHPEDSWKPKTLKSNAILPLASPLGAVLSDWLPQVPCRWLFPASGSAGRGSPAARESGRSIRSLSWAAGPVFRG